MCNQGNKRILNSVKRLSCQLELIGDTTFRSSFELTKLCQREVTSETILSHMCPEDPSNGKQRPKTSVSANLSEILKQFQKYLEVLKYWLKSIRGKWWDLSGSVSGVFDPYRGLWSSPKKNLGHFCGRFWPSLAPCQPCGFLWSQMACTGVPHIALHLLWSTRTYWVGMGHFRPFKVLSLFGRF